MNSAALRNAVGLKIFTLVGDAVTTMNHSCFFQQFGLQEP
jgi:hypothetical protein